MSTPNTSKVKWVEPYELYSGDSVDVNRVPVIPLADLTEMVEGIRCLRLYSQADVHERDAWLAQLEAHRKEG